MRPIDADVLLPNKVFFVNADNPMTSLDELLNRIINAPTLDVKPVKHGFWVLQDDSYVRRMCSVCGSQNHEGWESYCPNCGSKMDARMED